MFFTPFVFGILVCDRVVGKETIFWTSKMTSQKDVLFCACAILPNFLLFAFYTQFMKKFIAYRMEQGNLTMGEIL